ncbi:MAG: aldehyde dehydrogenase family protein, partial [Bacteroidota bacterium]
MSTVATSFGIEDALKQLGVEATNSGTSTGSNWFPGGAEIASHSPVDGKLIGKVTTTSKDEYEQVMTTATNAFKSWRATPAPLRGEVVRQFGEEL